MLKLLLILSVLALTSSSVHAQSNENEVRARIVGTWKVVSANETLKDGTKRPHSIIGNNGKAFLMYTADGYMCAQGMNPDVPAWKDKSKPTSEEKVASFNGFFSYCGRYEIEADKHLLIHLPEVSLWQDYVGTRQVRPYRFDGERMILEDTVTGDPEIAAWQIVWEKVKKP